MPLVLILAAAGPRYTHPETTIEARNPFVIEGKTVRILLHGGDFVLIDCDDFPRTASLRWSPSGHGYAQTNYRVGAKKTRLSLHRFLFGSAAEGVIVDHINGVRQDCRRSNLRFCTARENVYNRGPSKSSRTGYKGVITNNSTGRYEAQIKHNRVKIRLGIYDTIEEAAAAYDRAALKLFGNYARLNLVKKG